MAFVAPVVRKDYPIFMAGPVERKAGKTPSRTPKDPGEGGEFIPWVKRTHTCTDLFSSLHSRPEKFPN